MKKGPELHRFHHERHHHSGHRRHQHQKQHHEHHEPHSESHLDDVDHLILHHLQRETPLPQIAARLKIALGTVYHRIKKLEQEGVIKRFAPVINATKLGYRVGALIEVKLRDGHYALGSKFVNHQNVHALWTLTGDESDNVMLARFKDTHELGHFIRNLLADSCVSKTKTHVILNTGKEFC